MMKISRGCMKDEGKKTIYIIIAAVFFIALSDNIYTSVKSNKYRRLCDQYREQLDRTTNENRELADRLGRVEEITGQLYETTERNVTDARSIIETVEILRTQIQELEDCCYGSDSIDSYYNYWDNEFGISQ